MVLLTLSLLRMTWATLPAQDSFVVPAQRTQGLWFVKGSVDGNPVWWLIDSGADISFIQQGGPKLAKPPVSEVGGHSLPTLRPRLRDYSALRVLRSLLVSTGVAQEGDGIGLMGMDVLRKMGLGFDYTRAEVTFWTNKRPDAEKWIAAAPLWPGATTRTVKSISLHPWFVDALALPATIGSGQGRVIFDTGTTWARFLPKVVRDQEVVPLGKTEVAAAHSSEQEDAFIAPSADFGGIKVDWTFFNRTKDARNEMARKGADGVIGLGDLRSRRTVVDFAAAKIFYEELPLEGRWSFGLTQLLSLPVRVEGDKLLVGPVYTETSLRTADGLEFIEIAGVPASSIVRSLRAVPEGGRTLADLIGRTRKSYAATVNTRDGPKPIRVRRG